MTATEKIINYFEDNPDIFNECVEQLDSYNGFLGDDRFYSMEEMGELFYDSDPLEILRRAFYGSDEWGEEFNPNRDYFRFNGYGNFFSTDSPDYSDHLDRYAVEDMAENRAYIDAIEDDPELAALFDELESEGGEE